MSFKHISDAFAVNVGNPLRKLVLLKLADTANENGICWPSHTAIAKDCEMSKRSVITHLKWLEENGFINITQRINPETGRNFSNSYKLTLEKALKEAQKDKPKAGQKDSKTDPKSDLNEQDLWVQDVHGRVQHFHGRVRDLHYVWVQDVHPWVQEVHGDGCKRCTRTYHIEPINEPNIRKRKNATTQKDANDAKKINIEFSHFWNLYDKKVDKAKAEKKWNSLTNEQREKAIKAIPVYVQATPEKQFRKNPTTYLNNESWEDEVVVKATTPANNTPHWQQTYVPKPLTAQESKDSEKRKATPQTLAESQRLIQQLRAMRGELLL